MKFANLSREELSLFNSSYRIEDEYKTRDGFEIDSQIVSHIKTTFMSVKGTIVEDHEIKGETLDVEKYLQYRMDKAINPKGKYDLEFFNVSEDIQGMTVGILIDTSLSMFYQINEVRNVIASIYKGLEQVPNLKLVCNLYTCRNIGNELTLVTKDLESLEDCEYIQIPKSIRNPMTPTHIAINHITKRLRKIQEQTGNRTALIVLTDGLPQCINIDGSFYLNDDISQSMVYRAVTLAQANKIDAFAVLMGNNWGNRAREQMNYMFKGKMAICLDSDAIRKELLKKIDEFIIEVNKH